MNKDGWRGGFNIPWSKFFRCRNECPVVVESFINNGPFTLDTTKSLMTIRIKPLMTFMFLFGQHVYVIARTITNVFVVPMGIANFNSFGVVSVATVG